MCTGNFLVLEAVEDNLVDDYVWYREGVITLPSRTLNPRMEVKYGNKSGNKACSSAEHRI